MKRMQGTVRGVHIQPLVCTKAYAVQNEGAQSKWEKARKGVECAPQREPGGISRVAGDGLGKGWGFGSARQGVRCILGLTYRVKDWRWAFCAQALLRLGTIK